MIQETNKDTIIGLFNDQENSHVISLRQLFKESKDSEGVKFHVVYTMEEYADRRRSTDLERFNFDPFTGKKIDWNVVKNYKG